MIEEMVEGDIVRHPQVEVDIEVVALVLTWNGGAGSSGIGFTDTGDAVALGLRRSFFAGEERDIDISQDISKTDHHFFSSGFCELVIDEAEGQGTGVFIICVEGHSIFEGRIDRHEGAKALLNNDFRDFQTGVEVAVELVERAKIESAQVVQAGIKAVDGEGGFISMGEAEILKELAKELYPRQPVVIQAPVDTGQHIEEVEAGSVGVFPGISGDKGRDEDILLGAPISEGIAVQGESRVAMLALSEALGYDEAVIFELSEQGDDFRPVILKQGRQSGIGEGQ